MNTAFELFEKLANQNWTGEVEVTSSQGHALIFIKEGRFLWAHRPIELTIERFSRIEWLKMPDAEALKGIKTWETFVGLLLSTNSDQFGRVVELLKMDRLEVFFRIFFWKNVEIIPRQMPDKEIDPAQLGFYSLRQFDRLLSEARKRLEEWPLMRQRIGNSKRVFSSQISVSALEAHLPEGIAKAVDNADALKGLPEIPFSTEEIELLLLCDGRNTVQDIVRLLPEGEFLVIRRLLDLWKKSAIRPKDEEHSMISMTTSPLELQTSTLITAGFLAIALSLFWAVLSFFKPEPAISSGNQSSLVQALEVHRRVFNTYPMSLKELNESLYPARQNFQFFDYVLLNSTHYNLAPKAKLHGPQNDKIESP